MAARLRELIGDPQQVLELSLLEGGIQQRLIVELELDAALCQAIERGTGERPGGLQGDEPRW